VIVIDSCVFVAAFSKKDANHAAAVRLLAEIREGLWGRVLVPEYVFVEVMNFLHRRSGPTRALEFMEALSGTADSEVVPSSPSFDRALELYKARAQSGPSFADAGIVAAAERRDARNVATFDEGFRAFPRINVINRPRGVAT
jgi:predicted nucleic acid-binding protein